MPRSEIELLVHGAAQLLTMNPDAEGVDATDPEAASVGAIPDGALAVADGRIVAVGTTENVRDRYRAERTVDAAGLLVSPGLVDPHTHTVFAGSRHLEFGMRMRGATYHEILAAGGGIHSTVAATRAAGLEELVRLAGPRIDASLGFGVTTLEVKSGYGLELDTEIRMLEAVRELDRKTPARLVPTFLGAHVVPREMADRREAYVEQLVSVMIPEVARRGLAVACDVFLDEGAYTCDEAAEILGAAVAAGLAPKIHAGQFTEQHGPELVSGLDGALSADHLELISDEGIAAMAAAGVVANLLPGAAFSLRDHFPDGRRLIDGGVDVAVATDNNPGTSRTENLPLMASMAVTRMGLSCAEAWRGITVNAARALGLEGEIGVLQPGRRADLAVFEVPDFRAFIYHFGVNHTRAVYVAGRDVYP